MYIKLIQPQMLKRPMDTDLKIHMAPPLGLLTVANLLRKDHKVVLENENVQEIHYDQPDIVGISVTVDVFPRAMEISKRFREHGCIVVAGGIHITTASETIPPDAFDILCIGQAEGTWPAIISDYQKGDLKKIYRCSGEIRADQIVSPAYDLLKTAPYLYCNVVHTSRGCPYRCDFCYNSSAAHQYINRRIEDVIRDIRAIGLRHVMFIDDNFTGNPAWTRRFLNAIKPMKLKWNAAVSINVANDPELLDLMRDSGCRSLFIGFESVNPASIAEVHKTHNTLIQYEKAVEENHSRGIMINGSFVFGLDGDTPATFQATLDWIVRNKIETVTSHILTPYPGTVLFDRMKAEGRIVTNDLSLYNTAHVVYRPQNMTADELYQGYLWMYRQIYSLKNIWRRLPDAKVQRSTYLLFNLLYRKFGRLTDWLCRKVTYERIGKLAQRWTKYVE